MAPPRRHPVRQPTGIHSGLQALGPRVSGPCLIFICGGMLVTVVPSKHSTLSRRDISERSRGKDQTPGTGVLRVQVGLRTTLQNRGPHTGAPGPAALHLTPDPPDPRRGVGQGSGLGQARRGS